MTQQLLVKQEGAILHIPLNRPEQGNGVSDEMANAFIAALDNAAETAEFIVLRGAGDDFCTGRARDPNAPKPSRVRSGATVSVVPSLAAPAPGVDV